MNHEGSSAPTGNLSMRVIRRDGTVDPVGSQPLPVWPQSVLSAREIIRLGLPSRDVSPVVNEWRARNLPHLWRGVRRVAVARAARLSNAYGSLYLTVIRANGDVEALGLASMRVVTTAGVNKIVAAMNTSDAVTGIAFKFHGLGTGGTAEASADTALVTELTTQYNPDNTRATGTQTTGGSSNVYRTVGTNTVDATAAVTEHGVFSAATAGTLLDRSLFSVVNLASGDSLQATYDFTLVAGS